MAKEIRVPFEEIKDNELIRTILEKRFKERGMDLHLHDVVKMEDDPDNKERVLQVKNTKYFIP